jgi:thiamine biosynthesis protein ThiS
MSTLVPPVVSGETALTVNGAERRIPADWTLADLLASLGLDARTVVIERNGTILRDRSSFANWSSPQTIHSRSSLRGGLVAHADLISPLTITDPQPFNIAGASSARA